MDVVFQGLREREEMRGKHWDCEQHPRCLAAFKKSLPGSEHFEEWSMPEKPHPFLVELKKDHEVSFHELLLALL